MSSWSSFMLHILKDMIHAGYWLNLRVKGKNWTGQRENLIYNWISCEKHEAAAEGMAAGGRSVHTLKKVWLCGEGADTSKRPATNPLFNMPDIETDWSLPVLCSVYRTPQSWSEVSEETPRATAEWSQLPRIDHTRTVAARQPWSQSTWGQNSATCLPDKSAGREWFEASSDWCVGCSGTERYWCHWTVAQTSPCLHLRKMICLEYSLWHKLFKILWTVIKAV